MYDPLPLPKQQPHPTVEGTTTTTTQKTTYPPPPTQHPINYNQRLYSSIDRVERLKLKFGHYCFRDLYDGVNYVNFNFYPHV